MNFVNGEIEGEVRQWDLQGQLTAKEVYEKGRRAGSLVELPLVAYPLGTVPNGTTKTVDFTVAYNDPGSSNARITQAGGSVELAVSAGKNPDLSHNDNVSPVNGQAYSADTTTPVDTG